MRDFELKKREILSRVDIVEVVSDHVALKQRGHRWVGLCCFHSEKTPSLTVDPERGTFKCFGCGAGGDVFSFVQLRENVSFGEAIRLLADRTGVELEVYQNRSSSSSDGPTRFDIAQINQWAMKYFRAAFEHQSNGAAVREYVEKRGFSKKTVADFQLGLAIADGHSLQQAAKRAGHGFSLLEAADLVRRGDSGGVYGTFRNRLMFPIVDATSRVIGFGGRTLGDDRAKYLNTRQTALFDKGRGIYGVNLARSSIVDRGRAIVVEGYTDCMAAHQAGITETVASLGTALTESQVDLLRRYCDKIILLFDSDSAGETAANRAILIALPRCVRVYLARVPQEKDPCDFLASEGADAFQDVLKGAVEALEFKWWATLRRFGDDPSPVRRREAMLEFVNLVCAAVESGAVDPIQRGLLVNQVAHVLQVETERVHQMMTRSKRVSGKASTIPLTTDTMTSSDPLQSAWSVLLGVLLDDPDAVSRLEQLPSLETIADPSERRLMQKAVALLAREGALRLQDLTAGCDCPQDVQRLNDLAQKAAERKNHDETWRVALQRVLAVVHKQSLDQQRESVMDTIRRNGTADHQKLLEYHEKRKRSGGFAPQVPNR